MKSGYIFISHASGDDEFVKKLREALENNEINVWVDSRNLRQSDKLKPEIEKAIEEADSLIAVLSMNAVNSIWVRNEVKKALRVEKKEGYRVIPILLPDLKTDSLGLWFDKEPLAISIKPGPTGLMEAMPEILAALGERLPDDHQPVEKVEAGPVEELVLELTDPVMELIDGKRRARANATLIYNPAETGAQEVKSTRFTFTAPLGPIEKEELQWYLEKYYIWPTGIFKDRAKRVENQLPGWGHDLYRAAFDNRACHS